MLQRSLTELAVETSFRSRKLASVLAGYLRDPWHGPGRELVAACRKALAVELDEDHRYRFRLNDLDYAFTVLWPDAQFTSGLLPMMDELFGQVMERNGDFLQYRYERVQAYARLMAGIDPTLLAAWHLARRLHADDSLSPHDVERMVGCQLPFFTPPPAGNKHYAEGHVHLGGVYFDGLVLMGKLTEQLLEPDELAVFNPLRKLAATLLDAVPSTRDLQQRCYAILSASEMEYADHPGDWATLVAMSCDSDAISRDWLRFRLAHAMELGDVGKGWLWFVLWLWYVFQDKKTDEYERVLIFYLLASLMQVRSRVIMTGQGLSRFTERYYKQPLRTHIPGLPWMTDTVRRLFVGSHDLAEIKLAPEKFTPQLLAQFAQAVAQHAGVTPAAYGKVLPDVAVCAYIAQLERWHFCAHFLRRPALIRDRASLWRQADQLIAALCSQTGWNLSEFLDGHLNIDYTFQPGRWLRALDVAGDENAVRTEVYAPVLRWLRRGLLTRPFDERGASGFHISIHAGEDYAHPLSGMRHMDETARFCELRAGDRLGHGLALGIDPQVWVTRQGDMLLPVEEHLDNLVWAWHYATELSNVLPLAAQAVPRLERRIARFAADVASPEMRHRAWELRRNCYWQFKENRLVPLHDSKLASAVPDYAYLISKQDAGGAASLYLRRHEDLQAGNAEGMQRVKYVLVGQPGVGRGDVGGRIDEAGNSYLQDHETTQDLEFMSALQDYLLDKYDRMGLIIEANPSSNVYIGRLDKHSEHPIFRWYPPEEHCLKPGERWNRFGLRRGPIKVLVNTDDPGIIPTTLRTEYALLGEAAIDLGYSRTCVDAWLERLRQFGLDEFYRNHLPVFERNNRHDA
ncbi:hypothetical protein GJ700_32855 [Duganella sp. FT92W]|uniref:Adenosine deaminase n=1 Tax=Pseudoduganella rivuli TaxID=2666085 RepID=A0A7X2IUT5_9BURK|nr:antiviral RADAR system adenosine deaminase RdrB [Pseudoduganella rivuli]MRV76512.1 hypothetical protein [Pseudoduganella rivuli]